MRTIGSLRIPRTGAGLRFRTGIQDQCFTWERPRSAQPFFTDERHLKNADGTRSRNSKITSFICSSQRTVNLPSILACLRLGVGIRTIQAAISISCSVNALRLKTELRQSWDGAAANLKG